MRNAAEVGWDAKADQWKEAREWHVTKQGGSNCPLFMQEQHHTALTGDRRIYSGVCETWHRSFCCADRPGRLYFRDVDQKASARTVSYSATALTRSKEAGTTARSSLGQPRKGQGDWRRKIKSSLFNTVETEPKTSSQQVRKISRSNWVYWKAKPRRRWDR